MIRSIVLGIILLYIQIFKAGDWILLGIAPNLLIAYAGYLGAYMREKPGIYLIFFLGIGYDLVSPETLGLNTLLLLIICWLTGILSKSILEPKLLTTALLAVVYNFFYYLFFGLFYSLQTENTSFIFTQFMLSVLVNSIISIILFYFLLLLSELKISLRNVS
jgi:rod shape-determining protein MreD